MTAHVKKILIIGGGFAGIRCALDLEKKKLPNTKILLISDKSHFEFRPALYRVVTGHSPLEVCIPLLDIFKNKEVEVIEDRISNVQLENGLALSKSGSKYFYDYLVLAVGSRTSFFGIEGLKEHSFGFKSINSALRLKNHLHKVFELAKKSGQKESASHVVIVGGGVSGVEIAGELAVYTKKLAKNHGIDSNLVKVDLVEANSRIMANAPSDVARIIRIRLEKLGVNVMVNTKVLKEDLNKIYLETKELNSKTLIWVGGAKSNVLYENTKGLRPNNKGQIHVDKRLQPPGFSNVYIAGDGSDTKYSGLGSTAVFHGNFIASDISNSIKNTPRKKIGLYKPPLSMPVGPKWGMFVYNNFRFYGRLGWWVRRAVDLKVMLSMLPFRKALIAFSEGRKLCETCKDCEQPKSINSLV